MLDEVENIETRNLVRASNQLRCKNLLVITWDYEEEMKIENKRIFSSLCGNGYLKFKLTNTFNSKSDFFTKDLKQSEKFKYK